MAISKFLLDDFGKKGRGRGPELNPHKNALEILIPYQISHLSTF